MDSSSNEDLNKPLWRFITKLANHGDAGGNCSWKCNFCEKDFKSSYTRIRAHLLMISGRGIAKCGKVEKQDLLEMERLDKEVNDRLQSNAPRNVPLPPSSCSSVQMDSTFDSKKRKMGSGSGSGSGSGGAIEKAFNISQREHLDHLIARMFYSAGLPFNLANNPYFHEAFTYAANHNIAGYVPPKFNLLRTTLLQKEKANIESLCTPIKKMWKDKGVSIVSDGWSDSQRRPLINFMAVSDGNPMFIKSVDCSNERKDMHFIFNLLKEVIIEVGHENVVQVITDNASNCKGAGQLIEQEFPSIVWTPCVVHTLNLALKNICAAKNVEANEVAYDECNWITKIVDDVMQIKNFIMNHSMRLAIYNEFIHLKLLSVADTRFASMIVMLKRFKLIKNGLQNMVICEKWSTYRDDNQGRARFVKEKVLDDLWWDSIDYILSFTAPIYDMLRVCDTDKPCLHLVYDMWDLMIEKVKKVIYMHEVKRLHEESTFYEVVHKILVDRWTRNNTPLHCLAHALNPNDQWLDEDSTRVSPHMDYEINEERKKCLRKYFPNEDELYKVSVEYADFACNSGRFQDPHSIRDRYFMEPKMWWVEHGACAPMLQKIAFKLLAQPSSSSCAERNWSTYSFVQSARRHRMTPRRAEDLVFIHSNLRLLSRKDPRYLEGETKMWDIGGDAFDTFQDVGVLEVASLSLDEPDIESVLLSGGADNVDP
ncbi:uncharacterized protein LOC115732504 isoform X2 [Rhodamnia argentea]|uniref:Uncharacterized protein LOC115732504 isoform X2 n=1 Tax=Rhodamnia argentea TaxID=178133 RepID=A0ABM3H5V2_9MYRT|nr:uncharacterized protein LOC115732504 isoform X2 [Rhodamnia argentea]